MQRQPADPPPVRRLPAAADPRPSARTSLGTPALGGIVLALVGALALLAGVRRRSRPGMAIASLGALLAYRGLTGMGFLERLVDLRSLMHPRQAPRHGAAGWAAESSVSWSVTTIQRDPEPCYFFWRETGNMALVHDWIEQAVPLGDDREQWRLKGPGGLRMTVEMLRIEDVPGERIAWEAVDGDGAAQDGREPLHVRVDMREQPGRPDARATELVLTVRLPGGRGPLGALLRPIVGAMAEQPLAEALRRARELLETGEMATTEGQPSGRRQPIRSGLVPVGPGRRARIPAGIGWPSAGDDPAGRERIG